MKYIPRIILPFIVLVVAGLALAIFAVRPLLAEGAADIDIDPSVTFQTISGWEGTADLPDRPARPDWAPYRDKMYDLVVNEAGLNRVRLEIRSGAESRSGAPTQFLAGTTKYSTWKKERYAAVNDNDDPFLADLSGFNFDELDWHVRETVLPMRQRLAARGERLIVNLCYVSFRNGHFFQMEPEEYAELVLVTYQHLEKTFGFVPDLWEVVLEPDLQKYGWDGATMGKAMAAAGKRLRAHGYQPAFVAPSVTNMANTLAYANEIKNIPGARDDWKELSYHRYRGRSAKTLRQIAEFADSHGLRTSMLEWWFGKGTHTILYQDLSIGNVSAWQGRVVSGIYDPPIREGGPPQLREDTRFNRLYFTAIREGAVRINATSSAPRDFGATAFVNVNGRMAVIIEAGGAGKVTLRGLKEGLYKVQMAMSDQNLAVSEPLLVDGKAPPILEIPDAGVVSIVEQ